METAFPKPQFSRLRLASFAAVSCMASSVGALEMEWVTVGDAGNPPDRTGFGAVSYEFEIGRYEVTVAQYSEFMNAVDADGPRGLGRPSAALGMRVASDGRRFFEAPKGEANKPIRGIRFADAMRFANWLHNGCGKSDTECGVYDISKHGSLAPRESAARFAVTSEDEWYKAAYYQPESKGGPKGGYWLYPTASNQAPAFDADGSAEPNRAHFFTGAVHPSGASFRNTISLDQLAASQIGQETRYPSLCFSTHAGYSASYSGTGVAVPPETSPARAFARDFINGTPEAVGAELARVREGRSILDSVRGEARQLSRNLDAQDREKIEEYLTSVRTLEERMQRSESFIRNPKPGPGVVAFKDPGQGEDTTRMGLMLEVARLAFQADLTRLVTILLQATSNPPSKPGTSYAHHDLSHHGQDAGKIERLAEVEGDILLEWSRSLQRLGEAGLLRDTVSVLGSALGNASSHDATNLPILVGGGAFKHGAHLAFHPKDPPPLCNLWLQILGHHGIETKRFGTSTSAQLPGLET